MVIPSNATVPARSVLEFESHLGRTFDFIYENEKSKESTAESDLQRG